MARAHVSTKSAYFGVRMRNSILNARAASVAILLISFCSASVFAQSSTNTPSQAHRYLFIVETSRGMRDRARGVFNELKQALDTGLNGQIQQGDTVGIWTFNENVYQGLFPSQKWSQPTQLAFAVRLPALLEPETYQKRARLERLLPDMLQTISGSEAITIVLIASGEGTMKGTPFDDQINAAWKEWHDEQEGVKMPIITVLRARMDEITEWSLTPAPRPIEMPTVVKGLKAGGEKTNELAKGTSTPQATEKRSEPPKWGPEQQVAFSVWALGRTGLISTLPATSNGVQTASQTVTQLSAAIPKEVTTTPATGNSAQPLAVGTTENQTATNLTITFAPSQEEAAKPVAKAAIPPEEQKVENPIQSQTPAIQPPTRTPPPSVRAQPAAASDGSLGEMVAHARPADPADENRVAQSVALAAPRPSFLRENINPLVLMIIAAFGAGYCFRNWLLTNSRPMGRTMSLTRVSKEE